MKQRIIICCLLWIYITTGQTSTSYCPVSRTCKGCPENWNLSLISYKGSMNEDGTCSVTFNWDWKFRDVNPLLGFDCRYANGISCNNEEAIVCGSCQNFAITGINIDLDPVVAYSDDCGHSLHLPLSKLCLENLALSRSRNPKAEYYCPPFTQCSGCALDWGPPTFQFQGTSPSFDICDINISWDWIYNIDNNVNPNLIFTCIYAANGKYCDSAKSVCASCGNITFYGLEISLGPYIDYTDTCSNVNQYVIENCGHFTSPPRTTQQVTQQTTQQTTLQTNQQTTQQTTQKTVQQTTDQITQEPTTQQITLKTTQQTTQQTTQKTTHQTTQEPTQQTTQQTTQQPTQSTTKQTTQQTTQQPTQSTIKQTTQQTTQPTTKQTTQQTTQQPTQSTTKQTTQQPTQSTIKQTTQQPTQSTTKQTTQQPTQSTIKQTTDQTTQQPTQSTIKQTTQQTTQPTTKQTTQQITLSTTPPYYCSTLCLGCPPDFVVPEFTQEGVFLANNDCNVTITWDYPYPLDEEVRMTFACIYKSGHHCQTDESVCGSCETFLSYYIKTEELPHFEYSDSCGNQETIELTSDCRPL